MRLLLKILHSKIIWGMLAKGGDIMAGLILLPIMLHYMPKEQITLCFLFISISMLTSIADFGFNPTLTRNFSYAYAGAAEIHATDVSKINTGSVNWGLVGVLFHVTKMIYQRLSIFLAIMFYIGGTAYVYYVTRESSMSYLYGISCWLLFSTAVLVKFYFSYASIIAQGRGDVKLVSIATAVSRLIYIILVCILLICKLKLLAISAAIFIANILERFMIYKFCFSYEHKLLLSRKQILASTFRQYFKIVWVGAYRMGVASIGAYLLLRIPTLFAGKFLGLSASANYIFSLQVVTMFSSLAAVLVGVNVPKICMLAANNRNKQLALFAFSNLLALGLYLLFCLILIFYGNTLLRFISSGVMLMNYKGLAFLLVIYLLELQHANYTVLIMANNEVPFLKSALYSGVGIVVLSFFFLQYTTLGVWGLLLAQFIIQGLFNNWYWVYYICRSYNVSYFKIFKLGFQHAHRT